MNPSDSSKTEICTSPPSVIVSTSPTSVYHATRLEETDAGFCSEWKQKCTPVKRSTSGMDTKVFKAARAGNIDALREHSDHLHKLLTPTKNTVLHVYIACVDSAKLTKSKKLLQTEVVMKMLNMCPRLLLQQNESGDTALHLAARHGRADIVEVLIQASKKWHGDLEEGISSNEVCYQFLIRRPNEEKNTALHEAVRFNHLDVLKVLIEKDPEFSYSGNDAGQTPLYMAAERGYSELVSEMLRTCTNPSYQGPDGLTALHVAAAYGYEDIMRGLLETERTLARDAERGLTPLHMAAFRGHDSIVKQILEFDHSTAYIGDTCERTAAHHAACAGHVKIMKQLITYCPDSFELVDKEGRNALHYAILRNKDAVEKFVRKEAWLSSVLLNGKDSLGNTPLHEIATSEEYDGWEFINDSRVDKMAFNNEKKNALNIIQDSTDSSLWKRSQYRGLRNSGAREGLQVSGEKYDDTRVHVNERDKESRYKEIKESYLVVSTLIATEGDKEFRYKEIKESHLVVSTLIATVTFAAGFTLPGGYHSEKGPDQGFAVLSRNAAFKLFVITNTLAMTMSSCAIMIRFFLSLKGQHLGSKSHGNAIGLTSFALMAMLVAFLSGTYAVLGDESSSKLATAVCGIGCYYFVFGFAYISPGFHRLRERIFKFIHRLIYFVKLDYYFVY